MGLKWTSLTCILGSCLILFSFSCGGDCNGDITAPKALEDGVAEPRGRHRLQLLFPLLLRISTRLATLVSTALLGLFGIVLFVIFSKKALIISLFALFFSLSSKYNNKNEDIYIHKVNSYPDYNDEEHVHYYHHGSSKYKKNYEGHRTTKKWKKNFKRTVSPFSHIPSTPLPFNPLSRFQNWASSMKSDAHFISFPAVPKQENQNFVISEVRNVQEFNIPK